MTIKVERTGTRISIIFYSNKLVKYTMGSSKLIMKFAYLSAGGETSSRSTNRSEASTLSPSLM